MFVHNYISLVIKFNSFLEKTLKADINIITNLIIKIQIRRNLEKISLSLYKLEAFAIGLVLFATKINVKITGMPETASE